MWTELGYGVKGLDKGRRGLQACFVCGRAGVLACSRGGRIPASKVSGVQEAHVVMEWRDLEVIIIVQQCTLYFDRTCSARRISV